MMTTTTAPAAVLPAPPVVGEIEAFLQTAIAQMPPDAIETARAGPGRPRILPALCLWAGLLVCVLDETTLDRVARLLPALRAVPAGDVRLMPGKLAGRFDVRRQQWQHLQYQPEVRQNEKVVARELLAGVPAGSLLLADLGYFAFPWFDDLTHRGYWWVSRLRAKTSYTVIHCAYRADRAAQAVCLV